MKHLPAQIVMRLIRDKYMQCYERMEDSRNVKRMMRSYLNTLKNQNLIYDCRGIQIFECGPDLEIEFYLLHSSNKSQLCLMTLPRE
jgi:hypothetical protein